MTQKAEKGRAARNRTLIVGELDAERLGRNVIRGHRTDQLTRNAIICGEASTVLSGFPNEYFDLLFADPPYNLTKRFGTENFKSSTIDEYQEWLDSWLRLCVPLLKVE